MSEEAALEIRSRLERALRRKLYEVAWQNLLGHGFVRDYLNGTLEEDPKEAWRRLKEAAEEPDATYLDWHVRSSRGVLEILIHPLLSAMKTSKCLRHFLIFLCSSAPRAQRCYERPQVISSG